MENENYDDLFNKHLIKKTVPVPRIRVYFMNEEHQIVHTSTFLTDDQAEKYNPKQYSECDKIMRFILA